MSKNKSIKQGPNVKKLIIHKISLMAIPPGGGLPDAISFFTTPGKLSDTAREATAWVEGAIAAVRSATDNPYRDDEEIAGAILDGIARRKGR